MSDDILQRAKELATAATKGPWTENRRTFSDGSSATEEVGPVSAQWCNDGTADLYIPDADLEYLLGVGPDVVLQLIAEVERLRVEAIVQKALHERDLAAERAHGDRWQKLAGAYDEVRYALRNASDDQAGHAQFYNEAAELIFPEAQP